MHTKPKTRAQARTRKEFVWGISSCSIRFLQPDEVEAARESTSDCSKISPLPMPRRGAPERSKGRE